MSPNDSDRGTREHIRRDVMTEKRNNICPDDDPKNNNQEHQKQEGAEHYL